MGEILEGQRKLSSSDHGLLSALLDRHLAVHEDSPQRSLASLSLVGAAWKEVAEGIADPEIRTCLRYVSGDRGMAGSSGAGHPGAVGASSSVGSRFRIVRFHKEGGLGQVWVASDEELHRDVALKDIKSRHADVAEFRSRFVTEAEITGGLEHPGVVPVYGLGQYEDGRPFYVMRFHSRRQPRRRAGAIPRSRSVASRPIGAGTGAQAAPGPIHRRLQRYRVRAQPRRSAPRPQAGQHHARRIRRNARGRLGTGQGRRPFRRRATAQGTGHPPHDRRGIGPHANGLGHGHAPVHESRAGRRPARRNGARHRRLQPGGNALLRAYWQTSVRRPERFRDPRQRAGWEVSPTAGSPTRIAACTGGRLPQGDGPRAGRSLRFAASACRGSGTLAGRRAGRCAEGNGP